MKSDAPRCAALCGALLLVACRDSRPLAAPAPPMPPAPPTVVRVAPVLPPLEGVDRLVFRFQDASVPPPDHRSYTVTATPSGIRRVEDRYGEVLSDTTVPWDAARFSSLLATLKAHRIARQELPDGVALSPCSGGTTRTLTLHRGEQVVLTASAERCGGKDQGTLVGDLDGLETDLLAVDGLLRVTPE